MSQSNPRPESRIKSLEQRATDIEAGIVELSSDMAEELRAIRQELKKLTSFDEVSAYLQHVATKDDIKVLATKESVEQLTLKVEQIDRKLDEKFDIVIKLLSQEK